MANYPPYLERIAGDRITSDDWNHLQEQIREEIRQHRHEGETADSNLRGPLGARLENSSISESSIGEADLATRGVVADALQKQAFGDWAVAADAAIPEGACLLFDPEFGHHHDGIDSSPLAEESVGTEQLTDGAVTESKLTPELRAALSDIERRLAIPQALSIGSAPGGSYVDIIGHGFGATEGVVRLLTVSSTEPGYFSDAGVMVISHWSENKITVLLPLEPTGLIQVEVDGLPLKPLEFKESLVVTTTSPSPMVLDAAEDLLIQIGFSTELLVDSSTVGTEDGIQPMVLLPSEADPVTLDHEPRLSPPYVAQPIEVYAGDTGQRFDGELMVSDDGKTVTFVPVAERFPWDTPVLVRVHGAEEQANKPVLLAANNGEPMASAAFELTFTIRKKPPVEPLAIAVREIFDKKNKRISPRNTISRANQHAAPIEITMSPAALPSEWLAVRMQDGTRLVEELIPATTGGIVYAVLDARGLHDGPIQLMVQARNSTSASGWVEVSTLNPRTGQTVDWLPKDTKIPYLRAHPVRTPTQLLYQMLDIEVEPGSTVTVQGGARPLQQTDTRLSGRMRLRVPLNPNTSSRLRVQAVDLAGNTSPIVTRDKQRAALTIIHDNTIPELHIDPVKTPTRNRNIVLTGTSNESVTVVVTCGGQTKVATSRYKTPFRIPFSLYPNRLNNIKLVATDATGNTSPPVHLRVLHDDVPPPLVLHNKGYYRLISPASARPTILVRHTRVALGGRTEPGATVTLTGHGHKVTTRAGGNGVFTLNIPFQLAPLHRHRRREERTWHFWLDAVDPSGNYTKNKKYISLRLDYRIPSKLRQRWSSKQVLSWRPVRDWHKDSYSGRFVFYYCKYRKEWSHDTEVRPKLRKPIEKVVKHKPSLEIKKEFRGEIEMRPLTVIKPPGPRSIGKPKPIKLPAKEPVRAVPKLKGTTVTQKKTASSTRKANFSRTFKRL